MEDNAKAELPPPLPAMLEEAKRWEGTPHRNRMAKPGVGVDCLHLLRALAVAAEWLPPFQFPYYDPTWGIGRKSNVISRVILRCCHARALAATEPLATGDVAIWAVGRQSNHCGIVIAGDVWHAQAGRLVCGEPITEEMRARFETVLRIEAPGFHRRPETLTIDDFKA